MKSSLKYLGVALIAGLPLIGDIAPAAAQAFAPPPLRVEPVPPPSHRGWVWVPGRWQWNGVQYIWSPGHYMRPPRARAAWVPGHWVLVRGQYVWREGHWR
jgi:hypothetical protein